MIALIIGSPLVAVAVLLGCYGHRIFLRIQIWGEKLNEQDAIFQAVAPDEQSEVRAAVTERAAAPRSHSSESSAGQMTPRAAGS